VMKTTMAWNNQMGMAMQKRPLLGDFSAWLHAQARPQGLPARAPDVRRSWV